VAAKVQGIERIDLTGSGDNTVEIDRFGLRVELGGVTGGTHVLPIHGDAGDMMLFANPKWARTGSFTDRYVWGNGIVDIEQDLAAPVCDARAFRTEEACWIGL
jgi:hypothetical protein